ncbi:MAG TPA: CAP domain-containing protein [Desulfatiglandales bacterium]|nr:CAP domain-containing protein [Desulfatiglandales bacterium]
MKTKIITLLLTISILLFLPTFGRSEDGNILRYEQKLLSLINQARENPLDMAASLGMDPNRILSDLPDLYDMLTQGLPPLINNTDLYAVAAAHTMDMLENNYYSHDSPGGSTFDDRIAGSGYVPMVTGEYIEFIAFGNFIDPEEAIGIIFENMFRNELDPSNTERRNILAPEFQEIGIGLGSGSFKIGGSSYNVYMATCDFAASYVSALELELLELMNQARENPLAVAESLGMDPDQILKDLPDLAQVLIDGLPPLTFNENLYASAGDHARDMLENGYFSYNSPDGRTFDDRIRETGYIPYITGETKWLLSTVDFKDPAEGALRYFKEIFEHELHPGCTDRNIFNPEMKEVGISFIAMEPSIQGDESGIAYSEYYNPYYSLMMVCDFGSPLSRDLPHLKGRVFSDLDGDGFYGFGEGEAGFLVTIEGSDNTYYCFTNRAGGFDIPLEPGLYRIYVSTDEGITELWSELTDENTAVEFRFDIVPDISYIQ